PPEVASLGMLIIATIGLIVNIIVAWLLIRGGDTEENLNLRAVYLHVLGDLLGSIGAIVAAVLILIFQWGWADPLASVIVAFLVLMEGTPKEIDLENVIQKIKNVEGVLDLHDLHVWSITSGHHALSAHVVVEGGMTINEGQIILQQLEITLSDEGIHHVTIQLENKNHLHDASILCQAGMDVSREEKAKA